MTPKLTEADRDRLLVELVAWSPSTGSRLKLLRLPRLTRTSQGHLPLSAEFREQQQVTERADLGTMLGTILGRQNHFWCRSRSPTRLGT